MNLNTGNIKEITENVVRDCGYFLIDFNLRGYGRNQVIEVYIDGKDYINADDCAKVSWELNNILQDITGLDDSYRLDVSSPGIDRPLKFVEQFPKHINKRFSLVYNLNNETKKSEAELIGLQNDELTFLTDDRRENVIKFKDIIKAKVLLSF